MNEFDPTKNQGGPINPVQITPGSVEQIGPTGPAPVAGKAKKPVTLSPERRNELIALTIPGLTDRPLNGLSYGDEALLTKEKLSKEETVSIFVQFDGGEKKGAYRSVTINGYRVEVAKGKQQKLPKSLAALIMDAYQIEADTLNNAETNLGNADERKRAALGL